MADWILTTTDEDIDAALARAAEQGPSPRAVHAVYDRRLNLILIELEGGRRLAIPRENLQGLASASPDQVAHIEIFAGVDIAWPELDVDHYLLSLLNGVYGSESWMASLGSTAVAA